MNPYERTVARLASARWFAWLGRHVLTPLDVALRGSRFAPSAFGTNFPLCYLTATGRQSGKPRTVPLFFVEQDDGDGIVVVATNFGGERDPAWAGNLDANPEVTIQRDGIVQDATARRATEAEFAPNWERIVAMLWIYEDYRGRTDRDIKMYVIE